MNDEIMFAPEDADRPLGSVACAGAAQKPSR